MVDAKIVSKQGFEAEVCSRCGGCGEYSYCASYGTRCFKCRGAKIVLTKRGAAAKAHYEKLCSKPAGEVRVGETIQTSSVTLGGVVFYYAAKVTATGVTTAQQVCLDLYHAKIGASAYTLNADSMVRMIGLPDVEKRLADALTYQDNLTKAGTVRKTGKRATTKPK